MENKFTSFLIFIMVLLAIISMFLLMIGLTYDTNIYRDSQEGRCLTKIAKDYCNSRDMSFIKIFSPYYMDGFACKNRNRYIELEFLDSELRSCK